MTLIRHTLYMTLRHLRELWRQPWFVAVTLIQPVIQAMSFGLGAKEMAAGQYWIHPGLPEVVENALLGLDL